MPWEGGVDVKPTFLTYEKPLLTAMILCSTPQECLDKIQASLAEGADAIGIQLERLKREYRTRETLTEIFAACGGKPIYVTGYRYGESAGLDDDACAALLLLALDCGATLCDVPGDMFDPDCRLQLSFRADAVEKQKALIREIHRRGGEALMSCHTQTDTTAEENRMIAKAQQERGADIIKIVNVAQSAEAIPKYVQVIQQILRETDRKLLFLVGGAGRLLREIGPNLGVCMYLCVHDYGPFDTREQPLLKDVKAIRDHIRF